MFRFSISISMFRFTISMFRFSNLYLFSDSLIYIYFQILYSICLCLGLLYLCSDSLICLGLLYLCSDSLLYISMFRFSISMFRFSTLYLYVVCISSLSSDISRFTTCISRYGDIWVYPRTEECN